MKNVFAWLVLAVLVAIGAPQALANHIPMPDLPIGETAYQITKFQEKCGEVVAYSYKENGFWAVYTLNGKWLAVILYDKHGLPEKAWIIRNLDGRINEFLDNFGVLAKYLDICDAVMK